MPAVWPAGPEPMMTTVRTPAVLGALIGYYLLLDGRRLQRRPAVFHVDGELDTLAPVARCQSVAVLLQGLGELLEGQPIGRLAALLLGAHEVVEHAEPLGRIRGPVAGRLGEQLGRDGTHHRRVVVLVAAGVRHRRGALRRRAR